MASEIISGRRRKNPGTICLTKIENKFELQWVPIEGYPYQLNNNIFLSVRTPEADDWNPGKPFIFNCQDASYIEFQENPLSITFYRLSSDVSRKFEIPESEFFSVVLFVEQLIKNGITVPSIKYKYSLKFYKNCRADVYSFVPSHIQMPNNPFTILSDFWDDVINYFDVLLGYLYSCNSIPRDPDFPLYVAAESSYFRVVNKINKYIENLPKYPKISEDNISEVFDEDGRVKDEDYFRKRLYHSGVDSNLLPKLIPLIFNIHSLGSTQQERQTKEKELEQEFNVISNQVNSLFPKQIKNNKRVFDMWHVIANDVSRTDRQTMAFKHSDKTGHRMLTKLLKTFVMYNPPVGYLQGMNDLFVPIITAYFPDWNEDGEPIDSIGTVIDVDKFMHLIFWSFESMIINTGHIKMFDDVTEFCKKQMIKVHHMIGKISPVMEIWLNQNGLKNPIWCYSDFVLIFKRSFENVWPLWISINISPQPQNWLTYTMCAALILSFHKIMELVNEFTSVAMSEKGFQEMLASLDPQYIANTAFWIYEKSPMKCVNVKPVNEVQAKFEFFDADCVCCISD
ncbi:TBC domain containing protein [Histomonas meleagridis]|uniref:TBC domain containing protein n=1 Tax=Histomonas meleagridis TaxID=135588 RepID=UPI0035597339|nr:TBC domain containing protein [Histomonas meleagridis]